LAGFRDIKRVQHTFSVTDLEPKGLKKSLTSALMNFKMFAQDELVMPYSAEAFKYK